MFNEQTCWLMFYLSKWCVLYNSFIITIVLFGNFCMRASLQWQTLINFTILLVLTSIESCWLLIFCHSCHLIFYNYIHINYLFLLVELYHFKYNRGISAIYLYGPRYFSSIKMKDYRIIVKLRVHWISIEFSSKGPNEAF